jgi:hypothetical protein
MKMVAKNIEAAIHAQGFGQKSLVNTTQLSAMNRELGLLRNCPFGRSGQTNLEGAWSRPHSCGAAMNGILWRK